MIKYILTTFHTHDEEIETVHLPVVFTAILELLAVSGKELSLYDSITHNAIQSRTGDNTTKCPVALDALALALEILKRIPHIALRSRPPLRQEQSSLADADVVSFACAFYNVKSDGGSLSSTTKRSVVPFVTAFEDAISLSTITAKAILSGDKDRAPRDILLFSLSLLDLLLSRLDDESNSTPFVAAWEPNSWLSTMLDCLQQKVRLTFILRTPIVTFEIDCQLQHRRPLHYDCHQDSSDGEIGACFFAHQTFVYGNHGQRGMPCSVLVTPMRTHKSQLLWYLRPSYTAYHSRAVNLVWSLERLGAQPYVESVIAQSLSARLPTELQDACEVFGVFWRLTGMCHHLSYFSCA